MKKKLLGEMKMNWDLFIEKYAYIVLFAIVSQIALFGIALTL